LLILMNPGDKTLVDSLVESLDAPRPQVMFEAEIIEINQSLTESLGIDYSTGLTLNLTEADPTSILSLGAVARSPLSFKITLKALKNTGAANVLARPRVTTMDGVQAQLDATQTFPIKVAGASGEQSIQTITTGIVLSMTPKISITGQVEAELNISVSTPTGTTSDGVPQFSSRKAQTTVRVNNGESIVIGGLFEKRNIEGQTKVPLLGDIPILGALFSSSTTDFRQTDLLIIVTPRIVDMPNLQNIPTPSDEETNNEGSNQP
jgi:general secretion pathway protein D